MILPFLQVLFRILGSCWFILLSIFIGVFALIFSEQGQDVLKTFGEDENKEQLFWLYLFLGYWAFQSGFGSKIVLKLYNIHNKDLQLSDNQRKYTSLIIGSLPIIILAIAIIKAKLSIDFFDIWFLLFIIYHLIDATFGTLNYTRRLKIKFDEKFKYISPLISQVPTTLQPIKIEIIERQTIHICFYIHISIIALFAIFRVGFPQMIGAASVIVLALGSWMAFGTFISFYERKCKLPLFFIAFLFAIVFSLWNNNHDIRTLSQNYNKANSSSVNIHFNQWLDLLTKSKSDSVSCPVFIVSAEGGGIRAAYWTASVLASIQDTVPDFAKHVFAISSVSGGSLGAAVFAALLYEQKSNPAIIDPLLPHVKNILKKDFLSGVTASFVFPDLFQRFFFIPIPYFDRARALERSWEDAWEENISSANLLDSSFNKLWNSRNKYQIPSLFFNGTHVETGKPTLMSNLRIKDSHLDDHFEDLQPIIGKEIRLSTAILLSARFPGVTPPARIKEKKGEDEYDNWGHVVDGGYYENTGILTALNIYNAINVNVKDKNIRVILITIRNGKPLKEKSAMMWLYELRAPLNAFLNAWGSKSENEQDIAEHAFEKLRKTNLDTLISIQLERNDTQPIPLGWYLSKQARKVMDEQLKAKNTQTQIDTIAKIIYNYNSTHDK